MSSVQELPAADIERANELIQNVHQSLLPVIDDTVESVGAYDGKENDVVSTSTHIINATLLSVNAYIADSLLLRGEVPSEEDISVLASAGFSHDANKVVSPGVDEYTENSVATIREFLNEDTLGIERLLPGSIEEYGAALSYIIQRVEYGEDASETRDDPDVVQVDEDVQKDPTSFQHLIKYCRLGDAVASAVSRDGIQAGVSRLNDFYQTVPVDNYVNTIQVETIGRPLLNGVFIEGITQAIRGEQGELDAVGVPLGSSQDTIVYLGTHCEPEDIFEETNDLVGSLVSERADFSCDITWQKYELESLTKTTAIPYEEKRDIITEEAVEPVLNKSELERLPDAVREILPELGWFLYEYDSRDEVFEGTLLGDVFRKGKEQEGWGQTAKRKTLVTLAENPHAENLEEIPNIDAESADKEEGGQADTTDSDSTCDESGTEDGETLLSATQSIVNEISDTYEQRLSPDGSGPIETAVKQALLEDTNLEPAPIDSANMCFFCGSHATTEFKPGQTAVFKATNYTHRARPNQENKNICGVCQIELELVRSAVERSDTGLGSSVELLFLYSDDFVSNLSYGDPAQADASTAVNKFEQLEATTQVFGRQYIIQPFNSGGYTGSDRNNRFRMIHDTVSLLTDAGIKAKIGEAFTGFSPSDAVFVDNIPQTQQKRLGLDTIDSYRDLRRAKRLLDAINDIPAKGDAKGRQYNHIQSAEFVEMVSTAEDNVAADDFFDSNSATHIESLNTYVEQHCTEEYNQMRQVAELGIELYGGQYGGKHSRTEPFKIILEEVSANFDRFDEEENLRRHVAGQVNARIERMDYTGPEQSTGADVRAFVDAAFEYLQENDYYSEIDLIDFENDLINTYDYTYKRVMDEGEDEDADEDEDAADEQSNQQDSDPHNDTDQ